MRAREIIENVVGREYKPPYANVDDDTELAMAEKSPFTSLDLATRRRRHHPRLWAKVKGSVYEPHYRKLFPDTPFE